MKKAFRVIFILLFTFYYSFFTNASAQIKTDTAKRKTIVAPKLTIVFGTLKNGARITVADLKKMVKTNTALVLKDEKGITYTIVSFEFSWRQRSVSDDVVTGKPKTSYTAVGGRIDGGKLNDDWVQEINETLNTGDEFTFFNIIYLDKKTNKTYLAPELKIEII